MDTQNLGAVFSKAFRRLFGIYPREDWSVAMETGRTKQFRSYEQAERFAYYRALYSKDGPLNLTVDDTARVMTITYRQGDTSNVNGIKYERA